MSFNKSLLGRQNLTNKLDNIHSESTVTHHEYILILILSILVFILFILLILIYTKYKRKNKQKIRRQNHVVKKHYEPKPDDTSVILLSENTNGTINNDHTVPNDNINDRISDVSPSVLKASTISVASQQRLTTTSATGTNNDDNLSDVVFTDVKLRPITPPDPTSIQDTNQTSDETSENIYITEFKKQEKEKAETRKPNVSSGSSSSEGSFM